jgi:flagellar hook-associated protein 2
MMGMASGMDTDFIIQQSMRVHQMRIDNQMRARTNLQWRMDTHNDVRTQVNNFRNTFLTTQGNQGMLNRNVFNANVASAIGANSAAVSVRALGGSAAGSIRIGAINQLATGASVRTSDAARAAFQNTQASARLSTLPGLGLGQEAGDRVELRVGDDTVSITRDEFDRLNWNDATEVSRISLGNSVDSSHRNIAITRTPVNGSPGEFTYTFTAGPDDNRISGTISFSQVQDTNEDGSLMYDEDGQAVMVRKTNVSIDNQPAEGEANYALANSIQAALTSQISQNDEGAIQRNNSALTFNQELVVTAPNAEGEDTEFTLTRSSATADGVTTHTVTHNGTVINSDSFFRNQTININGTNVELRSNMTISQMLNAVNTQVSNVRMSFEPLTGRFNLENLNTGADSTLDLTVNLQQRTGESDEAFAARQAAAPTQKDNEAFFSVLGFTEQARDADGNLLFDENDDPIMNSPVFQGQNAVAYVNGDKIVSANNTFNFGGVAITLNSVNLSGGTGTIDDPKSENNILLITILTFPKKQKAPG